jgi:phage terminase large subunit GpA-like protein
MSRYKTVGDIFVGLADLLRPPERLTVSQAAEKYRYVNQPGAYVGPWLNWTTPYMVLPMDTFTSYRYTGMIFVGPAQSAKTDGLIINTASYSIKVDPMDMMIVCPTMLAARDFSIRRLDRLHRHSEAIGDMLLPGSDNDNTFDKSYINGMLLSLSWPTPTELAGKPIGRIVLTDRDRMVDDVDGDGEPFDLASKRTTTFGSHAMTVAESSPSRPVENLKWIPSSRHEAPPAAGILALYNRGDRRRWYWACPHCSKYFEGNFTMLTYQDWPGASNLERAETVRMVCPSCSKDIHPDERDEMQQWGIWLKDGQGIDEKGRVFGPEPRTLIASFWLNGVAAAFVSWKKLVALYLDAHDDFTRTGSEEALKKFYNNDLGEPYYPKSTVDMRLPEVLKARAEKLPERMVPDGVRFLLGLADVQKNMFVCQVFGILPGEPFDIVLVDRFEIRKSQRTDDDGERLWVKPSAYLEDWDELIEHFIEREYPLADGSGRMMSLRFCGCDSGGKEGVTTMAYNFYRRLREQNKHRRYVPIKGDHVPNQPRARISYPDSSRKDSKAGARGDIPVLLLNSNVVKDDLNNRLDCLVPGAGMFRFPDWLSDSFFAELCAEIRGPKGWEDPTGHRRNEAWDLAYYCIGLCVSELLRVEHIDWKNAPGWAKPWDENDLVRMPEAEPRFARTAESRYDFAQFGKSLA